ncbi:MAG: hypothetical protein ABI321_05480 [Polyangia bacterium]
MRTDRLRNLATYGGLFMLLVQLRTVSLFWGLLQTEHEAARPLSASELFARMSWLHEAPLRQPWLGIDASALIVVVTIVLSAIWIVGIARASRR